MEQKQQKKKMFKRTTALHHHPPPLHRVTIISFALGKSNEEKADHGLSALRACVEKWRVRRRKIRGACKMWPPPVSYLQPGTCSLPCLPPVPWLPLQVEGGSLLSRAAGAVCWKMVD